VARKEPFDEGLLAYCPAEDFDASYRFRKHGLNVYAQAARVYHFEAQANRLKRFNVTRLAMTNVAYLVRRNSVRPVYDGARYIVMLLRRIVAEFIKETGLRRFSYPQFRGALSAVLPSVQILATPRAELVDRYIGMQARTLGWTEIPEALRAPHPIPVERLQK
jgi:GT2 family glycosyltransferase